MVKLNKNVESLKINVENHENNKTENQLKEHKKLNVVMFKLPESNENSPLDSYKSDFNKVLNVIDSKKMLSEGDIVELYRIGKKQDNSPRPIIIKTKNIDLKQKLLRMRNLSYATNGSTTPIFLAPDRTIKELEQHKALIAELKQEREKGRNVIIRGGKVIDYRPVRFKPQDFYGSPETTK